MAASLKTELESAKETSLKIQILLVEALKKEGREHLLEMLPGGDDDSEGSLTRGLWAHKNIFARAEGAFLRRNILQNSKEGRVPLRGGGRGGELNKEDGGAFARYWEDTEGNLETISMAIGYQEAEEQTREWILRVEKRKGRSLNEGGGKVQLLSRLNNQYHDGKWGGPAKTEYQLTTQAVEPVLFKKEHYCQGTHWSPDDDTPAVEEFWPNGKVSSQLFKSNGRFRQRKNGKANLIDYWKNGRVKEEQWKTSKRMEGWGINPFMVNLHRDPQEGPAQILYSQGGRVLRTAFYVDGRPWDEDRKKKGEDLSHTVEPINREDIAERDVLSTEERGAIALMEMKWQHQGGSLPSLRRGKNFWGVADGKIPETKTL